MNIQALGSPPAAPVEDRPAHAVETVTGSVAAVSTSQASDAAPTRKQVAAAVAHINATMPSSAKSLEFSIDDDSKQTIVKIIDRNTMEVVRQIPSVEALEIAKSMDKLSGLLISQKA